MIKVAFLAFAALGLSGCYTTIVKFPGKEPSGKTELSQYRMTFGNEEVVMLDKYCNGGNIASIKKEYSAKNHLLGFFTLGIMHREDVEISCASGKGGKADGDGDGGKKKKKKKKA